jgi:arylsulfatase A-like enzyme
VKMFRRLLFGLTLTVSTCVFAAKPPNIVFILADDLGWTDLNCYGSSFHQTPNIDRLAREGMKFTMFYSAGSVCSPTRASILTGKYPVRTGITDWIPGQNVTGRELVQLHPRKDLAAEEFTLAEAFQAGGYQTIYVGKWHLGGKKMQPTDQGFDKYVGDEDDEEQGSGKDAGKLKRRLESTEQFTKASIEFLKERDQKKPFLLYLSYHDVHTPIQPMPGLVEPYQLRAKQLGGETPDKAEHDGRTRMRQDNPAYASMVAAVDKSVGEVRDALKKLALADDTIVVFTSDNGGLSTSRKAGPTSNSPLRAGKGWLYEGGIRVPLLVYAPGVTKAGSSVEVPFISNDFYPTLLDLTSLPRRPEQHMDGISFADVLRGKQPEGSRPLFWHYPHYHGSTWTPGGAIRDGDWKLVEFFEDNRSELYNLKHDPSETTDVSANNPGKKGELLERLHRWQKSVSAAMPVPGSKTGDDPLVSPKNKKRNKN